MPTELKSKRCTVAAVCTCLFLVTTYQVCLAGAQSNPLINKEAPELEVSQWVKGNATTLEKLKGKIVLLYFWAASNTASTENFPALIRFHRKYARDGLVIIAIRNTSLDKIAPIEKSSNIINPSDIPFRMAIDRVIVSPLSSSSIGRAQTVAAYGLTKFPAHVLIGKDGRIQSFGEQLLEKRINLLLYGHTRNLNTEPPPSQDDTLSKARKEFMTIAIGAMVLILIGAFVVIKRRFGSF